MLSAPRTLRLQISLSISATSIMTMAAVKAEEQVALLKVTHLEKQLDLESQEEQIKFKRDLEEYELKRKRDLEKHELKRKRDLEEHELKRKRDLVEHELKRKREVLKAKQKLEEASLQRQVLEEETDRGGYLPLEPMSPSAKIASQLAADATKSLPSKGFIQTSRFQTSFENNCETSPLSNTEQTSVDAFWSTLSKSEYPVLFPGATSQAHSSQGNATTSTVQTPGVSVQNFHSPEPKKLFSDKVKNYDSSAFDTRNTVSSATHLPGMNATCNDSVLPQARVQFNEMTNVSQAPTNNVRKQINEKQRRGATPAAQIATDPVSLDNNQLLSLASALQLPRDFPQLEVIKFNGDPRKYAKFIRTFDQTVGAVNLRANKKRLYLVQHCQGEAKQLIEYCCLLDPENGYTKALNFLKEKYGRPNVIARSYLEKLTQGPFIKSDNVKGLDELAQLLEESEVTLNCLNYQADLDNFNTMTAIVKRLPFALQTRWLRTAAEIEKKGTDAKFKNLVKFVKDESEIANSSFAAVVNQRSKKKGGSTFFTNSGKPKVTTSNQNREKAKMCIYCKNDHKIEDCLKFANLSISDRVTFNRRNRLCDNCFKGGHISSFCRSKSSCTFKDCSRKHHTLLHQNFTDRSYNRSSPSPSTSNGLLPDSRRSVHFASSDANCVFLNVVPVKVFYKNREIVTYAFLDQGSTTTL